MFSGQSLSTESCALELHTVPVLEVPRQIIHTESTTLKFCWGRAYHAYRLVRPWVGRYLWHLATEDSLNLKTGNRLRPLEPVFFIENISHLNWPFGLRPNTKVFSWSHRKLEVDLSTILIRLSSLAQTVDAMWSKMQSTKCDFSGIGDLVSFN